MQNWKLERQVKNRDDWERFIKEAKVCIETDVIEEGDREDEEILNSMHLNF
jgi:hypothetical protein